MMAALRWPRRLGSWHWQNLDERRPDPGDELAYLNRSERLKGWGWRHGRAWWRPRADPWGDDQPSPVVGVSWSVLRRPIYLLGFDVEVSSDHEDTYSASIYLPFLSLWLHYEAVWKGPGKRFAERLVPRGEREVRVVLTRPEDALNAPVLRWALWYPVNEWHSKDPKWRRGSFDLYDWLLGRWRFASETLQTSSAAVPMPEGVYPVTVELMRDSWTRPRLPLIRRTVLRAEIESKEGIPHPGKGDNAWDCDEDATFSLRTRAASVGEAVEAMRAAVMRSRVKYGGKDWLPRRAAA